MTRGTLGAQLGPMASTTARAPRTSSVPSGLVDRTTKPCSGSRPGTWTTSCETDVTVVCVMSGGEGEVGARA